MLDKIFCPIQITVYWLIILYRIEEGRLKQAERMNRYIVKHKSVYVLFVDSSTTYNLPLYDF